MMVVRNLFINQHSCWNLKYYSLDHWQSSIFVLFIMYWFLKPLFELVLFLKTSYVILKILFLSKIFLLLLLFPEKYVVK